VQDPVCEYLTWDSNFFALNVARVVGHRLTPERIDAVRNWSREHAIDCLYFLADSGDCQTMIEVARHGFFLTDVRIQFEMKLGRCQRLASTGNPSVRPFRPDDLGALSALARTSHRESRFYFDPSFPLDRCDELYATWIERSTQGWAGAVFVAEHGGQPVGYISCHLNGETGSIGLIAVDANEQRQGLGFGLVQAAIAFFQERGMRRTIVSTQGRNLGSQRLYQRSGFITESVRLWYHYWPRKLEH
jgi:dTDP-4-amino-4,6-dideoxy-D-galactose acyltransferase